MKTLHKICLINLFYFLTLNIYSQNTTSDEKILLNACMNNDKSKTFELLRQGVKLDNMTEASLKLYTILQNQTKIKSQIKVDNFSASPEDIYYLRKPEDIEIFELLLLAGVDTSMYSIVGKDISGNKIENKDGFKIVTTDDAKNDSRIVYQSDSGLNALEYSKENNLDDFVNAFEIISTPLLRDINQIEKVKIHLKSCDINQSTPNNGYYPLLLACILKNYNIIELLLENGANPNIMSKNHDYLLTIAINHDDIRMIKTLLKFGADPNIANDDGITPLHQGCNLKNIEIIKLLLDAGANPNIKSKNGLTPLIVSINNKDRSAVDLLIRSGADINNYSGKLTTPLEKALIVDDLAILRILCENGAKLNTKLPESDLFPISYAVINNRLDIVQILLSYNADPNTLIESKPLLFYSISEKYVSITKELINAGADITWKDKNDRNLLFYAQDEELLQVLINSGITIDELDNKGWSPLVDALSKNIDWKIYSLLKNNASIEIANKNLEVLKIDKELIKYLKSSGATFTLLDNRYAYSSLESDSFYGIIKIGCLSIPGIEKNYWPFGFGGGYEFFPDYKLKVSSDGLLNYTRIVDWEFINLQLSPSVQYLTLPKELFLGVGFEYELVLLGVTKFNDELIDYSGKRSFIAPTICLTGNNVFAKWKLEYRVRTKNQFGALSISFAII